MDNPNPNNKKIISDALELAFAGMQANMFENFDPKTLAKYCLAVSVAINNYQTLPEPDKPGKP